MERRADSAKQLSLPSEPVSAGATLARVPSMASSGAATGSQDALLFETPPDLVCPITFHLFRDPVINAAGQVYERAAIEQHLALKGTDPISGVVIQSNQLIPVYTLKSRAYEYRERVAKACVDKALTCRSSETAVPYLRRAAELVSGSGIKVPGLCAEVVEFLQTHPSNAYNLVALRIFADGLRQAGYVDQAMQLYLRLVEWCGDDAAQQAAALRQCLICFGHDEGDHSDKALLPFLAQFLESQQSFTASQVLDLLQEAKVPDTLIVQLCEHLLSRRARQSIDTATTSGPTPGLQFADLLLHYTQLRFKSMQRQLDALQTAHSRSRAPKCDATNAAKTPGKSANAASNTHDTKQSVSIRGSHEDSEAALGEDAEGSGGQDAGEEVPKWLKAVGRFLRRPNRVVASVVTAAVAVLDDRNVAVRLLKAGSVIWLVQSKPRRSPQ